MIEFLVNNKNAITDLSRRGPNEGKVRQIQPLSSQVFEILEGFLCTVQYGQLILVVQDGRVVKIEKIEKYIISAKSREKRVTADKSQKHIFQTRILTELQSIEYGQLVIRLENGKVEQIEKTEKRRINELEGLYGDGI